MLVWKHQRCRRNFLIYLLKFPFKTDNKQQEMNKWCVTRCSGTIFHRAGHEPGRKHLKRILQKLHFELSIATMPVSYNEGFDYEYLEQRSFGFKETVKRCQYKYILSAIIEEVF
jgi:hypothetical protein